MENQQFATTIETTSHELLQVTSALNLSMFPGFNKSPVIFVLCNSLIEACDRIVLKRFQYDLM